MKIYDYFDAIPPLTDEELKNPYSDFYYYPIEDPSPEICVALRPGNQMESSLALNPKQYEKIFTRQVGIDNGFCLATDGTGFSAVTVDMPGVTEEMMNWWEEWFRSDDVHYKIWLPGLHVSHHPIKENLGWGLASFSPVGRNNPTEDNYSNYSLSRSPKELEPQLWSHDCSAAAVYLEGSTTPSDYISLAHHLLKSSDGFQMRLYAWMGALLVDGEVHRMIPEDESVDIEKVRLFACHNAYEFSRCATLLPKLYERFLEVR